jgi:hypothetical protein
METGQIVIQFLKAEGVKPGNTYLQAKLLSPTKQLLCESEVKKKDANLDWSNVPPTIHNVKDAGNSVLKVQAVHKSILLGALDSIVGEVVIKVNELAPGVPYTRWFEFGLKEKDADKARLQKHKGHLGKVQLNLLYFNINARFLKTEFSHPIHTLIRKRYVDGVFHLIEKEKVTADSLDGEGNSCLHVAAECDVPEVGGGLVGVGSLAFSSSRLSLTCCSLSRNSSSGGASVVEHGPQLQANQRSRPNGSPSGRWPLCKDVQVLAGQGV